jgi:hypothetical protein
MIQSALLVSSAQKSIAEAGGMTTDSAWTGDRKRRQADAPHGALACPINRHKDALRVFFLVHERLLKVE